MLTEPDGSTRAVTTNSFGYYSLTEVSAGQTYIVSVNHQKYVFSPDSRILNISEDLSGVDFTAQV